MLPDDGAKLLAACEKKVLTSDYEDQKAEKKPASRKRRPKKSGFLNYSSKLDNEFESNGSRLHKHFNCKPARSTSSNATSHGPTNAGFRDELQSATRSELLSERQSIEADLQTVQADLKIVQAGFQILGDKLQKIKANEQVIKQVVERLAPGLL